MADDVATSPSAPAPLVVVDARYDGPVDLDTGTQGRDEVAASVAAARMAGAVVVRTIEPRAARRAAHVIDALAAARSGGDA